MLLTVNLGNSCVTFAIFDNGEIIRHGRLPLADIQLLTSSIGDDPILEIALASVVPSRTELAIALLSSAYCKPVLLAGRDRAFAMDIQCDDPEPVGVDRLLNALGAYARIESEVIVVDVGTAVTVDLISARGSFCGGAIAPGPGAMLRALSESAELLPDVALEEPASSVGHNTIEAMRSGAWYGAIGLVRELAAVHAAQSTGAPPVLVTGGAGEFVARALNPPAEYLPLLTLEGLAILAGEDLRRGPRLD